MRGWALRFLAVVAVAAMVWTAGLLAFAGRVERSTPAPPPDAADGVVALTGHSDERIAAALRLLQQGKAHRMLISGVAPHVTRDQLQTLTGVGKQTFDCCVDLGFTAENTTGNARETAEWARAKGYTTLILVTADYHMPRARLELRTAMPEARIITYPVATAELSAGGWWKTQGGAQRMILEYCKYIAVLARETVLGLGPSRRRRRIELRREGRLILARSILFAVTFYLWSGVLSILCLPVMLMPRIVTLRAFAFWSRGVIVLLRICAGVKVEVRGREHLATGKALIAAKHQCMFDVFAQFAWLPDSCFVMRKELMLIPFFGWYAWKARMIVVDREGGAKALKDMVRDAQDRLGQAPRQVVIFPEGTRGEPGKAGTYQPGVAGLYRDLALPVALVATNSGVHWPAHGFLRRPGTIVFEYLPALPAGLKRGEFMREMQEKIETASNALLRL